MARLTATDRYHLLGWFLAHPRKPEIHANLVCPHQSGVLPYPAPRLADSFLGARRQMGLCCTAFWVSGDATVLL